VLVAIYGSTQTPLKEQFLIELVHITSHERLPILMGGYFNILRHAHEKIRINLSVGGRSYLIVSLMG
jgi:hypothetical protein